MAKIVRYVELKGILQSKRREIRDEIDWRRRRLQEDDEARQNDSDNPPSDFVGDRVCSMKVGELEKVEQALLRLEAGTFGNCAGCGEEISARRLRALPFATKCRDCEEGSEVAPAYQSASA
jgi:DnaK suppressor protein